MPVIVDAYIIDSLRRKARTARLQACRASPTLELQLKSLAELYEADAERMATRRHAIAEPWTDAGDGFEHAAGGKEPCTTL
jgi:hypothetical protein